MSARATKKGKLPLWAKRGFSQIPEFDFSRSRRNPYARHFKEGFVAIILDPDVARAFPTAQSANDALRSLIPKRPKRKRTARKR